MPTTMGRGVANSVPFISFLKLGHLVYFLVLMSFHPLKRGPVYLGGNRYTYTMCSESSLVVVQVENTLSEEEGSYILVYIRDILDRYMLVQQYRTPQKNRIS